jgi:hypothetical protein
MTVPMAIGPNTATSRKLTAIKTTSLIDNPILTFHLA